MNKQKLINWALFILLALVWGSSFILMKKGAEGLNGWQIGSIRIFTAGLIFLPFGIIQVKSLPRQKLPYVILTGLIGNLFPAFIFATVIERKVESSLAGILNSLTPLFVIVIGALFFKVNIPAKKIAGVLVGLLGVLILSITKGPVTIGDVGLTLLILLATAFYGLNVNLVGTYLKGIDPIKMTSVSLSFLTVPSGIILAFNLPTSVTDATIKQSILASVVLGFFGSAVATVLFYVLIKRAGGLFASLVTYAVPVVSIFWGVLAHEQVGLLKVGCLGIILAGVYLANK